MKKLIALCGLLSILFGLLPSVYAAEITLNSRCGLADAIIAANSDRAQGGCRAGNGADTIILSRDITLDGGLPKITSEITIQGGGYTISGGERYRIFFNEGGTLTIHNLRMIGGSAENDGGLIRNSDGTLKADMANPLGGAIVNWRGTLSISESSFSDNSANHGGAVFNWEDGELSISEISFSDNSADGGGAIANWGLLNISESSFSDNSAGYGGAIVNWGLPSISGSSFSDNSADWGGAIYNGEDGELSISGSSFISNSADESGGAIYNDGELSSSISNSSFSGNAAEGGGGAILNWQDGKLVISNSSFSGNAADWGGGAIGSGGELSIINSIIAGGSGDACYSLGRLKQNINNFIEDGSCSPAFRGDPGLGALVVPTDGSPAYYPLLAGSRAIDAADDAHCSETDQIGTARPQGAACDIGAYEYVAP